MVCLTFPDNQAELPIEKLDSEEKTKALEQIKVANAERAKTESENASKVKGGPAQRDMGNSGGFIIIG